MPRSGPNTILDGIPMRYLLRAITTVITLAASPAVAAKLTPVAVVECSEAGYDAGILSGCFQVS